MLVVGSRDVVSDVPDLVQEEIFFCDSQSLPPFITIATQYDSCLVIYFNYVELIIFRLCHDNVRKKFKNDGEYQNENEISRRINKKKLRVAISKDYFFLFSPLYLRFHCSMW